MRHAARGGRWGLGSGQLLSAPLFAGCERRLAVPSAGTRPTRAPAQTAAGRRWVWPPRRAGAGHLAREPGARSRGEDAGGLSASPAPARAETAPGRVRGAPADAEGNAETPLFRTLAGAAGRRPRAGRAASRSEFSPGGKHSPFPNSDQSPAVSPALYSCVNRGGGLQSQLPRDPPAQNYTLLTPTQPTPPAAPSVPRPAPTVPKADQTILEEMLPTLE